MGARWYQDSTFQFLFGVYAASIFLFVAPLAQELILFLEMAYKEVTAKAQQLDLIKPSSSWFLRKVPTE